MLAGNQMGQLFSLSGKSTKKSGGCNLKFDKFSLEIIHIYCEQ